jgi:hypothetical protein
VIGLVAPSVVALVGMAEVIGHAPHL